MKFQLKNVATPLLLVSPRKGKNAEVSAYVNNKGQRFICTAGQQTAYSPADGSVAREVAKDSTTLDAAYVANFVNVGHCDSCNNDIVTSGSLADAIEVASKGFHCPACSSEISAKIDTVSVMKALASEHEFDDEDLEGDGDGDADDMSDADVDENDELLNDATVDDDEDVDADEASDEDGIEDDDADAVDDSGDEEISEDDDSDADVDDDSDVDMSDDSDADMDDDSDIDDSDMDDDDSDVDMSDDSDVDDSDDSDVEMADDDSDTDDSDTDDSEVNDVGDDADEDDVDDGSAELAFAVKLLGRARKLVASAKKRKATASDEDMDDSSEDMDDSDVDDADLEDSDEVAAAYQLVAIARRQRKIGLAKRAAYASDEDMDDDSDVDMSDDSDVDDADEEISSKRSKATADFEDYENVDDGIDAVPETPGTNDEDDDSIDDGNGDDAINKVTPGTDSVASTQAINWATASIELVPMSNGNKVVFANHQPVARLLKSKASDSVVTNWDNNELIATAFITTAKSGMRNVGKEFGFKPYAYKVSGHQVLRNVLATARVTAAKDRETAIKNNEARFLQSFSTAALGSTKGTWPDTPNHIAAYLIPRLTKMGVAADVANSLVEEAFNKGATPWLTAVTAKAKEISSKPVSARNEIASLVATASIKPTPAAVLSAALVSGSKAPLPATLGKTVASEEDNTQFSKVRNALLGRK